MQSELWRALRDCARTSREKKIASGIVPWDTSDPDCIRLAGRLKKRGMNTDKDSNGVQNGQAGSGRKSQDTTD